MRLNTYTLVVKGTTSDIARAHVCERLSEAGLSGEPVLARYTPENQEALILVHTDRDNPGAFGRMLALWLCELPFDAPYPSGSLLWYR